jgi:hypothetical protein
MATSGLVLTRLVASDRSAEPSRPIHVERDTVVDRRRRQDAHGIAVT